MLVKYFYTFFVINSNNSSNFDFFLSFLIREIMEYILSKRLASEFLKIFVELDGVGIDEVEKEENTGEQDTLSFVTETAR